MKHKPEIEQSPEARIEMFRSVMTTVSYAIKSTLIINGGGAIALMTFMGQTYKDPIINNTCLAYALFLFCVGILCAAVTSGMLYLTQFAYQHDGNIELGDKRRQISIILIACSYATFLIAAYLTASALGLGW